MSKDGEERKIRRAEDARLVMENPAYREAWMMVRAALVDKIALTNTKDKETMTDAVQLLQNLNRIEKIVEGFYKTGKVVIDKRSKLGIFNKIT